MAMSLRQRYLAESDRREVAAALFDPFGLDDDPFEGMESDPCVGCGIPVSEPCDCSDARITAALAGAYWLPE